MAQAISSETAQQQMRGSSPIMAIFQLLGVLWLILSWLFGVEPILLSHMHSECKHGPLTYDDYMEGSVKHSGDTARVRILTAAVYPGAKAAHLFFE